ncbi:MAG TPA: hypothetical protein VKU41_30805 [Polyangiaceae bacterium]|nr:hypothetical protein [Polyangiaceae bacterium]
MRVLLVVATLLWSSRVLAAGALDAATREAGKSLVAPSGASLVVAAPLASDQSVIKVDDLALRVAALLAGCIGAGARAHPQTAQLATARALAGRASALVYVQTEIARGDLRVTVDVYPSMGNAWDRIRNPLPSPTGHAFATVKVDAEVRSYLSPLLLEQASISRARTDEAEVSALACGDFDGDGGNEIVLVSRERVALGRIRDGAFVVERAASWGTLGPKLPVPMREAIGGAVVQTGRIAIGTTERGGVALSSDFGKHDALAGIPVWGGDGPVCLRAEPSAGSFDGAPIDCAPTRDIRPKMAVPAPRFDAFAATTASDAAGVPRLVVAVREPSGKVRLKCGDASAQPDGTFGAQLALGDLDEDGVPEIVTTGDGPDDGITIGSWDPFKGDLRPRLHVPAPAGVRALAVCPPEARGEPALVAVVGGEVWVIRAAVQERR